MKLKTLFCWMALLGVVMLTAGCRHNGKGIETGDLLFVGLPLDYSVEGDTASMASAIAAATGDEAQVNYIHVAILEKTPDTIYVIDATLKRGVARYPLDTMKEDFRLRSGDYPIFTVKRLKKNKEGERWIAKAREYEGRGYDLAFLPDNEEQYCSELVWNSYLDKKGEHIFHSAPMNFKSADGSYPPYWVWLFSRIGMPIPQDVEGTNPNDMARDEHLITVSSK
ncbi:MAG: hypothetical protein J5526_07525 [Bacteroidales bacterium]|nr:hypothetical protein [Bacteroidales bacterium]